MGTLVSIADFMVLLLFVVYIPRFVRRDSGSLLLSTLIALAIIIFAIVSFTANAELIAATSSLTRGIVLVFLLGMAALVRHSEAGKPVA
jgi:hypothetical protein